MSPLAVAVLKAATLALAECDDMPTTERVLREYREDARAVAVAVLIALGEKSADGPGSPMSQQLLELADELDNDVV